jgi:hypothetical protein
VGLLHGVARGAAIGAVSSAIGGGSAKPRRSVVQVSLDLLDR